MEDRAERSVWTVAITAITIFSVVLFVAGMLNTPEVMTVAIK